MTILMPKLTRAPNGDYFSRKVIPHDVREGYARAYGLRAEERFRHAADSPEGEAKAAFAQWAAEVEGRIAALRAQAAGRPTPLSHRAAHELGGRWYVWFLAQHEDEPGTEEQWEHVHSQYVDALESAGGIGRPDEAEEPLGVAHQRRIRAKLTELSQLPSFLAAEGLDLSREGLEQLLGVVASEFEPALAQLRRRAGGDYSADPRLERFPRSATPQGASRDSSGWTAWRAFEEWVKATEPRPSTVNRWRAVFLDLDKHFNASDIGTYSGANARAWRDRLLTEGKSRRVVREVWLTAAQAVFGWVKDERRKIDANPFEEAKLRRTKSEQTRTRDRDFTSDEIKTILGATGAPMSPRIAAELRAAYRWVPWLCAYTGARSGEITQLRAADVQRHENGFWTIQITPEAGAVKGQIARTVPLHDHLIEQGLLDYVAARAGKPLFYEPTASREPDDPTNPRRPPYVLVRQKLAAWVRKVGVTDKGISPNHAWRHTFKGRAAAAKIEERLRDAICGHAPRHIGSIYERPKVEELAEAIARFPRYEITTRG